MENEHRRSNRESRRWPYAFGAVLGGTVLGALIVMAAKGPSVVVVNNKDDNCCCCQQQRCYNPVGTDPITGKPRVGAIYDVPKKTPDIPCCDKPDVPDTPDINDTDRIARVIPFIPWWNNGGGSTRGGGNGGTTVTEIPVPDTLALMAVGGLMLWRLS